MYICLVLECYAAEMAQDVLHLGVCVTASSATKVVEPGHACQEEVDNSNADGDADRVAPEHDNSDDGSAGAVVLSEEGRLRDGVHLMCCAGQPAEDTEESRDSIDEEDSSDKLP